MQLQLNLSMATKIIIFGASGHGKVIADILQVGQQEVVTFLDDNPKVATLLGIPVYHSSEFKFAADMLQKVNDRYKDIIITKEDVAFIVKNRLLKKTEERV